MSREQGPRHAGMRPVTIAARRRQCGGEGALQVKEAAAGLRTGSKMNVFIIVIPSKARNLLLNQTSSRFLGLRPRNDMSF